MLKDLTEGADVSFEKSAIPSDAQIIEAKGPAGKTKGKAKAQPLAAPTKSEPKAKGKAKGKGEAKAKRPDAVGPAIGANVATPVSNIKTLPNFKVELLYSVPGGEQGSWVNLCTASTPAINTAAFTALPHLPQASR
jgi:hypothetical protein